MSLFERLFDNANPASLATQLRQARFALFAERLARLPRPVQILDVGGRQLFWERMGFVEQPGVSVLLLNREPVEATLPGFEAVSGDARDLAAYANGSFAVVFSNSVIEHLGTLEAQQRMAHEVQRVGRCYFVQTPNRAFPLEPHFLLPWFQHYPRALRVALVRRFDLGWYRRQPELGAAEALVDEHRLLSQNELQALFPGAEILHERVFGLAKSLIASGGWPADRR